MAKRIVWTEQARADIRCIEQLIAIQILKTLGRYALTGEGATKQLKGESPPMIRLRAQDHRIFFRDMGDYLEIDRVLDRKETYRWVESANAGARQPASLKDPHDFVFQYQ